MSRYRTIDVMMWGDARFKALSPIPPCGQGLWYYLLTGPHTTAVPGLFSAGERQLAEALGWPLFTGESGSLFPDDDGDAKGFRECWHEIAEQKMAFADWKARVVYIPRALAHNKPNSPNAVVHWRNSLLEIPECALKKRALQEMRATLRGWGSVYERALDDALSDRASHREQDDRDDRGGYQVPEELVGGVLDAKEEIDLSVAVAAVIDHLNEKAGTHFRSDSKATRRMIAARLKEGRTVEQMIHVVDVKCDDWLRSKKMRPYLRPETLFNATKFESYLGGFAGSGVESDVLSANREALRKALEQ